MDQSTFELRSKQPKIITTNESSNMIEPNDRELGLLRACAPTAEAVAGTIKMLKQAGKSEGWSLSMLAKKNGPAYIAWRQAEPAQQKPTDLARNPQRFAFRG
jgi:hypothetical protein